MNNKFINVPIDTPFLNYVARSLLLQYQDCIEQLASLLIVVPNYKTIKFLQEAFIKESQGKPIIIPRIISIHSAQYIVSDHILNNSNIMESEYSKSFFTNSISSFARNCILSTLIHKKEKNISLIQGLYLAQSLGDLLDSSYIENVDLSEISSINTSNLANHWQDNMHLLDIITKIWPQYLKEQNLIDEEQKKTNTYLLQGLIWKNIPTNYKIVFINTVSFHQPILEMIKSGMQTPNAIFYLHGLHKDTLSYNYKEISYNSPQKILAYTLRYLRINSTKIKNIPPKNNIREEFLHSIFSSKINKTLNKQTINTAINNLSIISTKSEEEESKLLALLIREKLENPKESISVICNNKNLIKRLLKELLRWNITTIDTFGEEIKNTLPFQLFQSSLSLLVEDFNINNLYKIIKHPFVNFGLNNTTYKLALDTAEQHIFRESSLNVTSHQEYFKACIKYINDHKYIADKNKSAVLELIKKLKHYVSDFLSLKNYSYLNCVDVIVSHINFVEQITFKNSENESVLWENPEGVFLSNSFVSFIDECKYISTLENISQYMAIFNYYFYKQTYNSNQNKHPRLNIYSSLQSTIINTSSVIIAGCNEDSLPFLKPANPWGNKYIFDTLGFIPQESSFGIQANYILQLLGSNEVIFTRSLQEGTEKTKKSRWIYKLQTTLDFYQIPYNKYDYLLNLIKELNKTIPIHNSAKPTINIKLNDMKKQISATELDTLFRNPYVFFITSILKYKELEPVGGLRTPKSYGTYIHLVLEDITKQLYKDKFIDENTIEKTIKKHFASLLNNIMFSIFQYGYTKNIIKKAIKLEKESIINANNVMCEQKGSINLTIQQKYPIKINAIIDRIDIYDNKLFITDYKTISNKPTDKSLEHMKQLQIASLIAYYNLFKTNSITDIQAKFLFLTKKYIADIFSINEQALNTKEDENISMKLQNIIIDIIHYLNTLCIEDNINFNFIETDNKISDNIKQFTRFQEWNNNIYISEDPSDIDPVE